MEPLPIHERINKRSRSRIMHRSQYRLQCLAIGLCLPCSRLIRTAFIAHVSMKRPPIETTWKSGSILFVILICVGLGVWKLLLLTPTKTRSNNTNVYSTDSKIAENSHLYSKFVLHLRDINVFTKIWEGIIMSPIHEFYKITVWWNAGSIDISFPWHRDMQMNIHWIVCDIRFELTISINDTNHNRHYVAQLIITCSIWHVHGSPRPTHWACALQWRHNGRDSVSNHQPHDCLLNRLFRRRSMKNIKAPCHWPFCGEFTGDRWIPRTNGQ